MDKDNKNALSETVGRVLQETQQAAVAAATAEVPQGPGQREDGEGESSAPVLSIKKPEAEEEAQVLNSIASATARRRAAHGLSLPDDGNVSAEKNGAQPSRPDRDRTESPPLQTTYPTRYSVDLVVSIVLPFFSDSTVTSFFVCSSGIAAAGVAETILTDSGGCLWPQPYLSS